jgi:toxin ParE1/3/4
MLFLIWIFISDKWSVEQADRYYNLIFDEINYICKNTASGKSTENVRKGYRASKVKSHLIFYRVKENTVEVIRILHERMDVEANLGE